MGNTLSEEIEQRDIWWQNAQNSSSEDTILVSQNSSQNILEETYNSSQTYTNDTESRRKYREAKMEEFKSELAKKHLARRQAIAERSKEILFLREELARQKKENDDLREQLSRKSQETETKIEDTSWSLEEIENLKSENQNLRIEIQEKFDELSKFHEISQSNHELRMNLAELQEELQNANSQIVDFEKEKLDYQTHVTAMKEVVKVTKQLLEIRERQLEEMREKVSEIQAAVKDQEASLLSTNLRSEYEKQLRHMKALKTLYEQRQAAMRAEKEAISAELDQTSKKYEKEQATNKELEERIQELETKVSEKYDKISSLESSLGLSKAECRGLQAEMSVINQLFSQILIGFNNGQLDLDKLILLLEENHDLLTDIVINEESLEHISALPKTLLDLIDQVHDKNQSGVQKAEKMESCTAPVENEGSQIDQQGASNQVCSAAEIVHNLPKVWRVLAELLSQQSGQQQVAISEEGTDPCYKSIETPKGPQLVLSVSQTFIRLKDLILEKKSLEKEMTRLKQLNTHLEVRLQDQEKRLETVSSELSKTWHVVGRMQRQHQQLHTHEKILRYELSQKRKMLNELKEELEYCREKWVQAREKNSCTEEQWRQLRSEFALRKVTTVDDLNNSGESGYSDERECSSDEESSYDTKTPAKNPNISSDTEENDETSHGSEGEDFLETAFSKACSSKGLEQPNLKLSTIFLNDTTSTSNNCDNLDTILVENSQNSPENNLETETEKVQINSESSRSNASKSGNGNQIPAEKSKDFYLYKILTNTEDKETRVKVPEVNFEDIDFSQIEIPVEKNLLETHGKEEEIGTEGKIGKSSEIVSPKEVLPPLDPKNGSQKVPTSEEKVPKSSEALPSPRRLSSEANASSEQVLPTLEPTFGSQNVPNSGEKVPDSSQEVLSSRRLSSEAKLSSEQILETELTNGSQNVPTLEEKVPESSEAVQSPRSLSSEANTSSEQVLPTLQINNESQISFISDLEPGKSSFASEAGPSISSQSSEARTNCEEILSRREARLRRLEEQCQQLVKKVTNTTHRGAAISSRLTMLHEQYGSSQENTQSNETSEDVIPGNAENGEDNNGENNNNGEN